MYIHLYISSCVVDYLQRWLPASSCPCARMLLLLSLLLNLDWSYSKEHSKSGSVLLLGLALNRPGGIYFSLLGNLPSSKKLGFLVSSKKPCGEKERPHRDEMKHCRW